MQNVRQPAPHGPLSPESIQSHNSSEDIIMREGSSFPGTPRSEPDEPAAGSRKVSRLGRACDPCSTRKTKCDQGKPCGPCRALDIPCTFERPRRRRGPPNRLAEAIKREHESKTHTDHSTPNSSSPDTPTPPLTAESIGPIELVGPLLDDYFAFMHPLFPFPHEPTFRESFRQRRDRHDSYFLAMLAAMVGVLVASYPRRPRQRLKSLKKDDLFTSSRDFVIHCHSIATRARGGGYLEKDDLSSNDGVTSFCLLIMCGCSYRLHQADLYCGEVYNIVRCLFARQEASEGKPDYIEQEITRRLFWSALYGVRTSIALNATLAGVPINTPSLNYHYPPLPGEIDDELIHQDYIEPQPPDRPSRLVGYVASMRLAVIFDPLVSLENSSQPNRAGVVRDLSRVLSECTERLKTLVLQLPESLSVWPGPASRSPSLNAPSSLHSPNLHYTAASPIAMTINNPDHRLEVANEIQKANIGITYLSSRSYFLERYFNLLQRQSSGSGNSPGTHADTCTWIRGERENIAQELLDLLDSITPLHLEPNGAGICFKIRQITATLMPDPAETAHHGVTDTATLASDGRLAAYLNKFLYILTALERGMAGPMTSPAMPMDRSEEEDLRAWASLRQYQLEYAEVSGKSRKL